MPTKKSAKKQNQAAIKAPEEFETVTDEDGNRTVEKKQTEKRDHLKE